MKGLDRTWGPRLARALLAAIPVWLSAGAAASGLDFDRTFQAGGEPPQVHFKARYPLGGKEHRVEVWRDRDLRLRRRTDDAIETFVFKPARQAEWQMVVLDLGRKIRTDIDRTNLYRIGHFTDWFSMSHALARPAGAYALAKITEPVPGVVAAAPCQWYGMTIDGSETLICWSSALHLPMLMTGPDGQVRWQVDAVDTRPQTAGDYRIADAGFVRNNANEDIQAD